MKEYDHKKIEPKWQKEWAKKKIYHTEESLKNSDGLTDQSEKPKSYVLDMFPYPSGDGLHVGHPKGYIATDIYSRFKKMTGHNVLHPMGWDAFGLPAENYAIKNKVHPRVAVEKNIKRYKEQLSIIGPNYDWSREINTTDPKYYKWTQWIFLKLLEKGLAFQSFEPINWCPSCQTGLANEDLEDGKCERCGSVVEKKPMRQWVLKITDYAERLLADLSPLNWPESIKESQKNWIGKSEGLIFNSPVKDINLTIQTFSAHFEAYCADTFVVIAPDHPFLPKLLEGLPNEQEILKQSSEMVKKRLSEGYANTKELEGIFTGRYTVDPVGNGNLPIWIANFALADYGTGIVKCSAHDQRDFDFAKKYKIPLKAVLFPVDPEMRKRVEDLEICYTDMKLGVLSAPSEFAGRPIGEQRQAIAEHVEKLGLAKKTTTYKLRDWVFSRQRYWGEPIPVIHCDKCGAVPVPEKDLPVKLPEVKNYAPTGTGESPLAAIDKWVNVKCPKCRGKAKRETNTMPQWAGSCWYYLRYMDPKNSTALVDSKKEKYWAPVDVYVGGAEHATRHLIYARFWHKFLYDIGVVSTSEPFTRLHHVGLILAEDGRKMSKRFGNVVNPDEIIAIYGADTFRIHEMFMGPFSQSTTWDTKSIMGSRRFIERIWRLSEKVGNTTETITQANQGGLGDTDKNNLESILHSTIKKVSEDIESFSFNTAISSLMILSRELESQSTISKEIFSTFLHLLAPFAPHVTDELWNSLGNKKSIHLDSWPVFKVTKVISDTVKIMIQVNGKVRDELVVKSGGSEDQIIALAMELENVKKWLNGAKVKRSIVVKNRLINFVTE